MVKVLDGRALTTIATFSAASKPAVSLNSDDSDAYSVASSRPGSASATAARRPASAGRLRPSSASAAAAAVGGISRGVKALALDGRPSSARGGGPNNSSKPGATNSSKPGATDSQAAEDDVIGFVVVRGHGRQAAQSTYAIAATASGRAVRIEIGNPLPGQSGDLSKRRASTGGGGGTEPAVVFNYHIGSVWGLATERGAGGRLVATTGDDRRLCVWDTSSYTLLASVALKSGSHCCHFDQFSQFIAVGSNSGGVSVYSLWQKPPRQAHGSLSEVAFRKDCKEEMSDVKFSPDNDKLAAGSHDNTIVVYNVSLSPGADGSPGTCTMKPLHRLRGHTSYITHFGTYECRDAIPCFSLLGCSINCPRITTLLH